MHLQQYILQKPTKIKDEKYFKISFSLKDPKIKQGSHYKSAVIAFNDE
jgi:hypothetical protein